MATTARAQTRPTSQPLFGTGERDRLTQLGSRGVRVHDPSTVVRCGEDYWVFYTSRGVRSYHSRDLLTWEPGPRVFESAPAWNAQAVPGTRELSYWAPDVIHLNGRYLLYYSVSVFGKNISAIGLATNPTLDPNDPNFKWSDEGIVIQCDRKDDYNTIDPALARDADGKLWMAFGSYWSGIKLIELDLKTGKRRPDDDKMYSLAHAKEIEAAYIHRHGENYYLFVNWGICCRGVNSTYNIRVGRSKSITGPYIDKDGIDMNQAGGSVLLQTDGAFIGPGHAGIITQDGKDWLSMHFYDGTRNGAGTLAIRELRWDTKGWPMVVIRAP